MANPHKLQWENENYKLIDVTGARLKECLASTYNVLGIKYPDEYIARGTMYSLVDKNGNAFGGAILVTQPPFRSLESIPIDSNEIAGKIRKVRAMAEINGIWLAEDTRSPFASFMFWTLILRKLLETSIEDFLFTFDNSNERMSALVKWASPRIIYSGRTKRLAGMKSPAIETIAIVDRKLIASFLDLIEGWGSDQAKVFDSELIYRLQTNSRRRVA